MFTSTTRRSLIGIWVAILVAAAVAASLSGVSITVGMTELWLAACLVPPAVLLMVWRGAPPPTIAEVLHTVDPRD
jgi:hypothetical protein